MPNELIYSAYVYPDGEGVRLLIDVSGLRAPVEARLLLYDLVGDPDEDETLRKVSLIH